MKMWKRALALAISACLLMGLCACSGNSNGDGMILNKDGSYGGTLSEEKYGKGAPLNGEYDVKDSDYYVVNNDYYNMPSTDERVIVPHFASYQQTMQDSSGLACLLMILNHMGEDVSKKYTELALVERYEKVNETTVYGNGTTPDGLVNLVNDLNLGYEAKNASYTISGSGNDEAMEEFFVDAIKTGKFVFVRYQSPVGYGWKLVIGYDTQGNIKYTTTGEEKDHFGEDVVIFAEPYDGFDHCQDGYATERAKDFLVWWRDMTVNGDVNEKYSCVVVDTKKAPKIEYQPVDETVKQTLYDIHLPRNANGSYGGTRDSSLYGSIVSGSGYWNHTDSNYYKINDFYNMGSEGSRVMLKNYTILQQTMRSSCGLCAVNSVRSYYGETESPYDMEVSYLNLFESLPTNATVNGRGSAPAEHFLALSELGYTSEYGSSQAGRTARFPTYEEYIAFMRGHLEAGRPVVVSTNMGSGHFIVAIGYDDMGTDYIYDDVMIAADPCDYWDGYQDGYNVYSATKFYRQHTNSKFKTMYNTLVIYPKEG